MEGCIFAAHSGGGVGHGGLLCECDEVVESENVADGQARTCGADDSKTALGVDPALCQFHFLKFEHIVQPGKGPGKQAVHRREGEPKPLESKDLVQPDQRVGAIGAVTVAAFKRMDKPVLFVDSKRPPGDSQGLCGFGRGEIAGVHWASFR